MQQVEKYDKMIEEEVEEKRKQLNDTILNASKIQQRDTEKVEQNHSPGKFNNSQYNQSKKWSHHNSASGHSTGQDE